jgi:hypothetical protein
LLLYNRARNIVIATSVTGYLHQRRMCHGQHGKYGIISIAAIETIIGLTLIVSLHRKVSTIRIPRLRLRGEKRTKLTEANNEKAYKKKNLIIKVLKRELRVLSQWK